MLIAGATFLSGTAGLAGEGRPVPAPAVDETAKTGMETAIVAGGCFWGVQGVYQHVEGVVSATSGYIGGSIANPGYEAVSSGATGHAEAVKITYDPEKVSYGTLLQIFFSVVADPTTLNYQGPDRGTQYRTAIFATTGEQAEIASTYIAQLEDDGLFDAPIVTRVETASKFYRAEDYHQDYLTLNPSSPYIIRNDLPKIANLKTFFPDRFRVRPVLEMH
ncbi:methionine sulfoxide reductase A [Paracoccus halophilus]|nr:methionine sulfoxide reductase A [Paracoccus halophilus]